MLPAHFSLNCHISHGQSIQDTPHSHRRRHTKVTFPHCPPTLPVISSKKDVSWCDWLPHAPWDNSYPRDFFSSHAHTSVPSPLDTHTVTYLLLILTLFLLNGFFLVFHSMACAFFLLFLRIWMSMPHWKKQTNNNNSSKRNKNIFPNCGGLELLGVSTTLIRDVD